MDKLQKANQSAVSTRTLSDYVESICPAIYRMNMIRAYPLSDAEIEHWAITVERIDPTITREEIETVVDGMITGRYEYEKELGIKNILNAIKLLRNGDQPISYFELP